MQVGKPVLITGFNQFLNTLNFNRCKFVEMRYQGNHIISKTPIGFLIVDMRDCYTKSFTEFIPFCPQLFYFSSFKDFKTLAQA